MSDLAMGLIASGVTSQLLSLVSHPSSCFLRIILPNFSDQVNGRFTCWIPGFMPQLSQPLFKMQVTIQYRQLVV